MLFLMRVTASANKTIPGFCPIFLNMFRCFFTYGITSGNFLFYRIINYLLVSVKWHKTLFKTITDLAIWDKNPSASDILW